MFLTGARFCLGKQANVQQFQTIAVAAATAPVCKTGSGNTTISARCLYSTSHNRIHKLSYRLPRRELRNKNSEMINLNSSSALVKTRWLHKSKVLRESRKVEKAAKEQTSGQQSRRKLKLAGPISWTSLLLAGLTGSGVVYYFVTEKEKKQREAIARNTKAIGKPKLGGQWTLVDHTGRAVTDATLREKGEFALLYFGFTYCPDICPAELIKMKKIVERLDALDDIGPVVVPVFISVDPKRDGVAQVAHYIKDFHPRMVGLTGTPDQVSKACRAFRVYHSVADQDAEDEDDYLVDHSIVMYLIGPDGVFLDFYTQLTEVDEAVERIRNMIKETREELKSAEEE